MWQDTTEGDGGADQGVELLVTTDGKLQVAGRDTLDLEILGGVLGSRDCVSINSLVWEELGSNRAGAAVQRGEAWGRQRGDSRLRAREPQQ